MTKHYLGLVALMTLTTAAWGAVQDGTIIELKPDAIKIQQGGVKVQMFPLSNELLTNTVPHYPCHSWGARYSDLKVGKKVQLDCFLQDGRMICAWARLDEPNDAGTVTAVGKNTITIHNDSGKTVTYSVAKELAENSRPDDLYSMNYPSRFAQVKVGCRVEVVGYMDNGQFIVAELDVK